MTLQRRNLGLKIKLELEKTNEEVQVCQEFDINHAVNVSNDEQMFKYLNSWRESANKDIPDMYAKDDEGQIIKLFKLMYIKQKVVIKLLPKPNMDIQAENSSLKNITEQPRDLLSIALLPK